eukprot:6311073-Prymnesium_polylepis.1
MRPAQRPRRRPMAAAARPRREAAPRCLRSSLQRTSGRSSAGRTRRARRARRRKRPWASRRRSASSNGSTRASSPRTWHESWEADRRVYRLPPSPLTPQPKLEVRKSTKSPGFALQGLERLGLDS